MLISESRRFCESRIDDNDVSATQLNVPHPVTNVRCGHHACRWILQDLPRASGRSLSDRHREQAAPIGARTSETRPGDAAVGRPTSRRICFACAGFGRMPDQIITRPNCEQWDFQNTLQPNSVRISFGHFLSIVRSDQKLQSSRSVPNHLSFVAPDA